MKNNNNKNISDLKKNANLKKDAVSSIYPRFLTYRSYVAVTEKSNTYDISFPQASISKNYSVSLIQLLAASQKQCWQLYKFFLEIDTESSRVSRTRLETFSI